MEADFAVVVVAGWVEAVLGMEAAGVEMARVMATGRVTRGCKHEMAVQKPK